ncbi:hypothetical protein GUJ93_ZPchr0006g42423 [Zizania palustris]|uniref:Uncharacterized protein n=1 Tax=Zizania palustris TaxID=103762 RepID=A0A8J5W2M5_ZIZPA|nr:hypothetical protein GUJ93_ZPchr0006g42423 [Zizania palustris]
MLRLDFNRASEDIRTASTPSMNEPYISPGETTVLTEAIVDTVYSLSGPLILPSTSFQIAADDVFKKMNIQNSLPNLRSQ